MGAMYKKGVSSDTQFLLLFAVVAILAASQLGLLEGFGTAGASSTTTKIEGLPACIGIDKTTVTLSAFDKFDNSKAVNGNHQYKINGGRATTVSDGGTFDASPGDQLLILWAQGNNSGTDVYLNKFEEVKVPCQGTKTYSSALYRNGTITSRIFNEEGNLIDSVTENETLDAGDSVNLNYELQGQNERGQFKAGGCAIVEYNQTAYDDVKLTFDAGNERIDTPDYYTVANTANTAKTYSVPAFDSNTKLTGTISIEVDNNQDPTDSGGDILIQYVPNEYRLNPDNNVFQLFTCGEDQDGNRVANEIDTQGDTLEVD